jgi:hypothetical protein
MERDSIGHGEASAGRLHPGSGRIGTTMYFRMEMFPE